MNPHDADPHVPDETPDDAETPTRRPRPGRAEKEDEVPPPPDVEADDRFPSGPWTGFFLQKLGSGRHWMELNLTFRSGTITGAGRDWVGPFAITGRYSTQDGTCRCAKRYVGKHDVSYEGYNEGRGIWGLWTIDVPPLRGGFHIWPVGMPDPTQNRLSEEEDIPVPADSLEVSEFGTVESDLLVGTEA